MREKLSHKDGEKLERARSFHIQGEFDEAQTLYEKLLRKHPKHPAVQSLLGTLLVDQGKPAKAIPLLQRSAAKTKNPNNHYNLALAYDAMGDLPTAIKEYRRALKLEPKHSKAHFNLGLAYRRIDQHEQAIQALLQDYALGAKFDTCRLLAKSYIHLGRHAEALLYANQCVELEGASPDDLDTLVFLLCHKYALEAFVDDEQRSELIALADHALNLNPRNITALVNAGRALSQLGEYAAALAPLKQAVQLDPENESAHTLYAVSLLTEGNLLEGWHERTLLSRMREPVSATGVRRWQGELREGLRLLVLEDEGVGDQILYVQMLKDLVSAGVKVTYVCDPRMAPIIERSFPEVQVAAELAEQEQQSHDAFASLGELHLYLRKDLESLGDSSPYLQADPTITSELQQRYQTRYPGKTVTGLAWHSHSAANGAGKSVTLDNLLPVLKNPDRVFVCVQYGEGWEELEQHARQHGYAVHFDERCNSMDSLDAGLAQLAAVDELVSVSNASVHMAAALGKPVHALIGMRPVWHWFSSGDRSPWYVDVSLYRQEQLTDWTAPIQSLAAALKS